jgi:hypothetical protein
MTYPNIRFRAPVPRASVIDYPYFRASASADSTAPQTQRVLPATDPPEAANDEDGPRRWYQIRNPLWVIAIGMAFLFAVMALFVALG